MLTAAYPIPARQEMAGAQYTSMTVPVTCLRFALFLIMYTGIQRHGRPGLPDSWRCPMWVLEIEPRSSERVSVTLNQWPSLQPLEKDVEKTRPGMAADDYNPSIWEAEARQEFKVTLSYMSSLRPPWAI